MQTALNSLTKEKPFGLCQINTTINSDISKFIKEYESLESKLEGLFRIQEYTEKKETSFQFSITIPEWEVYKENSKEIEKLLVLMEKSIVKESTFHLRTVFSYPPEKYLTDPELPITLEEQKNRPKLVLAGIRVKFPDIKEIDSVIIDLQKCPNCDGEHIFIQVFQNVTEKFTLDLIEKSIVTARKFSLSFIKSKGKKMPVKISHKKESFKDDFMWHVEDTKEVVICQKGIPERFSSRDRILRTYLEAFNKKIPSLTENEQINRLEEKVRILEDRLKLFEKESIKNELVEVRDISMEQVQKEMLNLLSDGKTRYFDEIAEILHVDIKIVVESYKKLNSEGKLFIDEQCN